MKTLFIFLLTCLVLLQTACKKDDKPIEPNPPHQPIQGTIRPIGQSLGTAVKKLVDQEGGMLQSADGFLTITVPAGALSEATEVSIELITSTCKGSIGHGWRLKPHGKSFIKPVQLTVDYTAYNDSVSLPEALGLAYQDEEGIWRFIGASTISKTNHTVSMSTNHFSDWTLLQWMTLSPITGQLHEKQQVALEALQYVSLPEKGDQQQLPLAIDYENGYPVGEPQILPSKYIGEWSHSGLGLLNPLHTRYEAVYMAPESITATQTVAVTLSLKGFKSQAMLVSNLTLLGKQPTIEYLQVTEHNGFGGENSVLTIYGANFGQRDPLKSTIFINKSSRDQEILLWSDKIIICTIPIIGTSSSGPVQVSTASGALSNTHILNEWNVAMRLDHPHARVNQSLLLKSVFHLRIRGDASQPPQNLNIIGKDTPNTVNELSSVHWEADGKGLSTLNNDEACGEETEVWTSSKGTVHLTPDGNIDDEMYFKAALYLLPGQGFEVTITYQARNVIPSRYEFVDCKGETITDNRPFHAYLPANFHEERLPLLFSGSTLKAGTSATHYVGMGSMKLHTNGRDQSYEHAIKLVWEATPGRY